MSPIASACSATSTGRRTTGYWYLPASRRFEKLPEALLAAIRHRRAVDQDHAGAAFADPAAVFAAGKVRPVAQRPQQRDLRVELEVERIAVDGQAGHGELNGPG